MKCLVLSDTFPNRLQPWRGPYNRRQVECLVERCSVTVINPIPFGRLKSAAYRRLVSEPGHVLEKITTLHPVWWYLPVIGRGSAWRGVLRAARRALGGGAADRYDVVLATFAYPHGFAARELARELGIPYAIKARGSDLHALPPAGPRRERAAEAVRDAAAVVAVSGNLADVAVELGADPSRVHVLPNGIDADAFAVVPRDVARRRLGLDGNQPIVLFVGSLLPVKGIDVLCDAFAAVSDAAPADRAPCLTLIGDGSLRGMVEKRMVGEGLGGRVKLTGQLDRKEVALWMNAADVLVLPSRNEGCPNVVLEAMACGTPVVASKVGAVPDLLDDRCGAMVPPGDARALARAMSDALAREWDRDAIRERVAGMTWEANAAKLYDILTGATAGAGRSTT